VIDTVLQGVREVCDQTPYINLVTLWNDSRSADVHTLTLRKGEYSAWLQDNYLPLIDGLWLMTFFSS